MGQGRRFAYVAIIVALLLVVTYSYHVRILASVWHLRHGNMLVFGNYVVPVPANWYPESVGEENELLVRLDTDASGSHEGRNPHASILLFAGKQQEGSQISELFNREEAFLNNKGGKEITSRTFDMGGETVFCLGGDQVDSGGAYKVNPTS